MVACKVTFSLGENGTLEPVSADQQWPVFEEPMRFQGLTFMPELDYRKQGIDIVVFGEAVAPRGWAVRNLMLRVECGGVDFRVEVFGDRVWQRRLGGFGISEPAPFETMSLSNERAFGGSSLLAGEKVVHSGNQQGRGYCATKEDVEGKLLPNLERSDFLIQHWTDSPVPACLYRPVGLLLDPTGPRSFDALSKSEDPLAMTKAFSRYAFNNAVPDLVCPSGRLGQSLRLSGFDADGDLVFPVPPEQAIPGRWGPTVHVCVGDLESRFPLAVSMLVVLIPERVVIVTYLALFRYLFRPEELRSAELRWSGEPEIHPVARSSVPGNPNTWSLRR